MTNIQVIMNDIYHHSILHILCMYGTVYTPYISNYMLYIMQF